MASAEGRDAAPMCNVDGKSTYTKKPWILSPWLFPTTSTTKSRYLFSLFHLTRMTSLLMPLTLIITDIQPQPLGIQIQLILPPCLLQQTRNIPRILNSPEIHITPTLLDGITDEFRAASLTLRAYHCSLFFLASFVDHEGRALGFLLGDLFGFYCGGEFGGEGEVLEEQLLIREKIRGG